MTVLINRASMLCLDVNESIIDQNGANVQQYQYANGLNQKWEDKGLGNGFFWFRNMRSGKALDADTNTTNVHQWEFHGGDNQQWSMQQLSDGWFWLRNRATNKALDVDCYWIGRNGGNVQQMPFHGAHNQQWRMESNPTNTLFGQFEFATQFNVDQIMEIMERLRFVRSRIDGCNWLSPYEKLALITTFERDITKIRWLSHPSHFAEALGDSIFLNWDWVGGRTNEMAQTLIHEMMHLAGYNHPVKDRSRDIPGQGGPYFGSPPLLAEKCIAGTQSLTTVCVSSGGKCIIKRET